MASWTVRLRDLSARYGKVALGVHFSVSALSTTAFYVAVRNNVDLSGIMETLGVSKKEVEQQQQQSAEILLPDGSPDWSDGEMGQEAPSSSESSKKKATMGAGSALGIALLCNKALFPVRVPITLALTPPVARLISRIKLRRSL